MRHKDKNVCETFIKNVTDVRVKTFTIAKLLVYPFFVSFLLVEWQRMSNLFLRVRRGTDKTF